MHSLMFMCTVGLQSSTIWQTFSERDRISWWWRNCWPDLIRRSRSSPEDDEKVGWNMW